jgi:hypothetical protein
MRGSKVVDRKDDSVLFSISSFKKRVMEEGARVRFDSLYFRPTLVWKKNEEIGFDVNEAMIFERCWWINADEIHASKVERDGTLTHFYVSKTMFFRAVEKTWIIKDWTVTREQLNNVRGCE